MTPITTTAELAAFCDKIKGQPFVAVDTEFMRETTYWPKLCLIQAAAPSAEATIDPLAEGSTSSPFLEIMRDERILKVFHAAAQDVEIFNNLQAMPQAAVRHPGGRAWPPGSASRSPMTPWCARC
jgi:ribonuclease D